MAREAAANAAAANAGATLEWALHNVFIYFPMKIDDREPVVNENGAIYLPIEIVVLMVMLVVLALPNNNRSRSSSI